MKCIPLGRGCIFFPLMQVASWPLCFKKKKKKQNEIQDVKETGVPPPTIQIYPCMEASGHAATCVTSLWIRIELLHVPAIPGVSALCERTWNEKGGPLRTIGHCSW
jgi:hypothetical protein